MKNYFVSKTIVLLALAFVVPLCAMQVDENAMQVDGDEQQDAERKSSIAAESSVVVATPRRSVNDILKDSLHVLNSSQKPHVPAVLVDMIHGYYHDTQQVKDIAHLDSDGSYVIITGVVITDHPLSKLDFYVDELGSMLKLIGQHASDYVTGFSGPHRDYVMGPSGRYYVKDENIAMDKAAIDRAAPLVCKTLRTAVEVGGQINNGYALVSLAQYFPHPDVLQTALALGARMRDGRHTSSDEFVYAVSVIPKGHPYEKQAKKILRDKMYQELLIAAQQAAQVVRSTVSSKTQRIVDASLDGVETAYGYVVPVIRTVANYLLGVWQ